MTLSSHYTDYPKEIIQNGGDSTVRKQLSNLLNRLNSHKNGKYKGYVETHSILKSDSYEVFYFHCDAMDEFKYQREMWWPQGTAWDECVIILNECETLQHFLHEWILLILKFSFKKNHSQKDLSTARKSNQQLRTILLCTSIFFIFFIYILKTNYLIKDVFLKSETPWTEAISLASCCELQNVTMKCKEMPFKSLTQRGLLKQQF